MAKKATKTTKKQGLKKQAKVVTSKASKGGSKATSSKKQVKTVSTATHYKSCKVRPNGALEVNDKLELIGNTGSPSGRLIISYDTTTKDTQKLFTGLAAKAKKKGLTVKQYLRLAIAKA